MKNRECFITKKLNETVNIERIMQIDFYNGSKTKMSANS